MEQGDRQLIHEVVHASAFIGYLEPEGFRLEQISAACSCIYSMLSCEIDVLNDNSTGMAIAIGAATAAAAPRGCSIGDRYHVISMYALRIIHLPSGG